ncbi:hypothetical protein D5R40_28605 [Okeania hirsuta]|uniref:Uncharacterized protein n=1 Tax=Okeania hirsuta TaxID=1458930 RepID=A0A3N6PBC3_9CYAN|nr:hypothetical protein D4Z78_30025 [Okeania hirsuta]RQH26087.1 hypothetical protein D5R40_28605 [Okeania hirsuta]
MVVAFFSIKKCACFQLKKLMHASILGRLWQKNQGTKRPLLPLLNSHFSPPGRGWGWVVSCLPLPGWEIIDISSVRIDLILDFYQMSNDS